MKLHTVATRNSAISDATEKKAIESGIGFFDTTLIKDYVYIKY